MAKKLTNPTSVAITASFSYAYDKAKPAAVKKLAKVALATVDTAVAEAMKKLQESLDAKYGVGTFSAKAAKLSIEALPEPTPAPAATTPATTSKKAAKKAVKKSVAKKTAKKSAV